MSQVFNLQHMLKGSGCGSVGRAVASTTRALQFKSSHCQKLFQLLNHYPLVHRLQRLQLPTPLVATL